MHREVGGGVPVFGGVEDSPEHGLEQPGLTRYVLSKGLGRTIPEVPSDISYSVIHFSVLKKITASPAFN